MSDDPTMVQRLAAETLGTALLVFIGAGSVPATLILNGDKGLSMADLGVISFAFAMVIIAAIYSLGHVSGCHINPAVTVGLAASGNFPCRDVPAYVIAQVVGAILGAVGIIAALGHAALDKGLGVNSYSISWANGGAAEVLGTFILVFTVLGVIHRKAVPGFAGLAIGFVVFAIIIAVGPTSGGSLNPARYIGPFLIEGIFGKSDAVSWSQVPVYVIAQFVGALLAVGVYTAIFRTPADGAPSLTAEVEAVSGP